MLPCAAEDNYFLLEGGQCRSLRVEFLRREGGMEQRIAVRAWSSEPACLELEYFTHCNQRRVWITFTGCVWFSPSMQPGLLSDCQAK